MNSSQLKIFTQNNLKSYHSQMKGSIIKSNPSKLLQPSRRPKSLAIFGQPHSQQFSSSPKILCHMDEETNILSENHYKSQICTVNGKFGNGANKRVNTSVKAQNYSRTQVKSQDVPPIDAKTPQNPQSTHVNESGNRYQFCCWVDFESESKMSLSYFQQNYKNLRLKKLGAKTQEEIINFKLEGSNLNASQTKQRKSKTTKEQVSNLYITQQTARVNFVNQNTAKASTARVRNIPSRINQQESKKLKPKEEQSQAKTTKQRANSASFRKHHRKGSAKQRQSIHMNIINLVEQRHIQNEAHYKAPFSQLYNRFARSQKNKILDPETEQAKNYLQQRPQKIITTQGLQKSELKDKMPNNYEQLKKERKSSANKSSKQIDSEAEIKLKQRKSIVKSYTFKKQSISKIKQQQVVLPEDFHVSGWNNSTQFERKQLIMIV